MRVLAVLVLTALALVRPAAAAPHKILVLPVDGTADPATRAKLTAQIVKLAKGLGGQVSTAEATYADTALAVGCAPQAPSCSDQVIATLAVDQLVWATATKDGGQTKLIVRRAAKGAAPREVSTTIAAGDSPEHIDAGMAPLFASSGTAQEPGSSEAVPNGVPPPALPGDRDRSLGIAFVAGGGVSLVFGLALWASYASLQDSINQHPLNTPADFDDVIALEDRASTYAIAGDGLVLVGLAAGGIGAYYLNLHHNRSRIAVTPAPIANGAGLTLTILGGL